jgi:SAM-dependent methyltransferase
MTRILNVGCGSDTYGTDFLDMYPSRENVIQCDLEKGFPFPDDTFDEVYSKCLYEHLKNPFSVLLEMKRVAKKGGRIRLITDHGAYWANGLNNTAHTGAYEKDEHPDDRHYCFFTKTHLVHHFRAAGLELDEVKLVEYFSPTRMKRFICVVMQSFLKLTPFRNMAYGRLEISGVKNS